MRVLSIFVACILYCWLKSTCKTYNK